MNAKTSIKNPLTDLLAGRSLDQMGSIEIEALIDPMNVKAGDARAAVAEAERKAHTAVGSGVENIQTEDITRARMEAEFCAVAQATIAGALTAAKEREKAESKAARVREVSELLDLRNAAGERMEQAIAMAAKEFREIISLGKEASRASRIKLESSVIAEFRTDAVRHLFELEMWRETGGLYEYSRVPFPFDGSFPPISRFLTNASNDLLTELDMRN